MTTIYIKRHSFVARFKALLSQLHYHKLVEVGSKPRPPRTQKDSVSEPGKVDTSKWQKMDSRALGITRLMVPSSPYTLLKILRGGGFEAYLVGGCVRDLILNRTPKDFDVITTADLHQIKKQFHRCVIVGRRFPICRVHIKGTIIEVSSFKTLAKESEEKEKFLVSQMPRGCNKFDLNLWKNSMRRDFTVNSLFFDPLNYKIYDYNNAMKDLLDLKLRTIVPAHVSFTEDCARILRGLRIAARLGLSLSKDVETAIHKLASSILNLSPSRIMMEMDYMFSFGAAESSLRLLHRFHILKILLPFQAAYISRQTTGPEQSTMMLMKLFSHLDELVSCDQPAACCLWIGLLAFHQTLLNKPQHPFVVLTFGCVLYHQSWRDGLKFARKYSQGLVSFDPETLDPYEFVSDDEVAKKVNKLTKRVIDSIDVLVDPDTLHKTMSRFPGFSRPGLVFVSKNAAHSAVQLFYVLAHKAETYDVGRSSFEVNHQLLGKGDTLETIFTLGKIIMKTMGCKVDQDDNNHLGPPENMKKPNAKSSTGQKQNADTEEKSEDIEGPTMEKPVEISASKSSTKKSSNHKKQKSNAKSSNSKKQNGATKKEINDVAATDHTIEKPVEMRESDSPTPELMATLESCLYNGNDNRNGKLPSQSEALSTKEKFNVVAEVEADQSTTKEESVSRKRKLLQLSSLFK
ncbi:uncharacterized protein LOC143540307 [Bidens hawaiensis]|uniref:uncharacterized protein LOC143540307 n=1 Tax=Bidens hawaiensis TaxID=980011 RepID=UPI004048F6B7